MTKKTKKTFIFSILGIIAIAISIGLYFYFKGPVCVKCASGKKVAAPVLYHTFTADSTAAKKEFSDKILEVSGLVTSVSENQQKQVIVFLKTDIPRTAINCTMEGPAEKIHENDSVIIKGICSGLGSGDADLGILGDVYLGRCFLVK